MPHYLSPYKTIWLKPKDTFVSFFNEANVRFIYLLPFLIYAISIAIDALIDVIDSSETDVSLPYLSFYYLVIVLFGFGVIYLFLGIVIPWLMTMVGRIWSGPATLTDIANINALSAIPYILILIYQLVMLVSGNDPTTDSVNPGFQWVVWLVSFRILIIGISHVQNFSYGIALLNILITYLPFFVIRLVLNN